MKNATRLLSLVALLATVALMLILSACGGTTSIVPKASAATASVATPTPPPTPTPTPTPDPVPPVVDPPVPAPIVGPVVPPTSAIPAQVMAAMEEILKQIGVDTSTATVAAQTKPQAKRAALKRVALPATVKVPAHVHAMAASASDVAWTDPVGFQFILTGKRHVGMDEYQSVVVQNRQPYPNGGMFFFLEVFSPKYGGAPIVGIQGPVNMEEGYMAQVYYRNVYDQEGIFTLYGFFLGGDGTFVGPRKVTYECGPSPVGGQVGYHADKGNANAKTYLVDVVGKLPTNVTIYAMLKGSRGAGWSNEQYFSDGEHMLHRDYQTGYLAKGIWGWGMLSEGNDEGSVYLFIANPGQEEYLTLDGVFSPPVDFTKIGG